VKWTVKTPFLVDMLSFALVFVVWSMMVDYYRCGGEVDQIASMR